MFYFLPFILHSFTVYVAFFYHLCSIFIFYIFVIPNFFIIYYITMSPKPYLIYKLLYNRFALNLHHLLCFALLMFGQTT